MKIHTLSFLAFYFSWRAASSITIKCNNSWAPQLKPDGSVVNIGACYLTDASNEKEMKVEGTHPDNTLVRSFGSYCHVNNESKDLYHSTMANGSSLVYLFNYLKKDEKITTFCSDQNCVSLPRHSGFYKFTIDNQPCPTITKLLFFSNNKQIGLCITSTKDKQAENQIHIEDTPQQYQVIYLSTDVLFKKASLFLSLPVLENPQYDGFIYSEILKEGKSLDPISVTHSNGDGKEKTKFIFFDYSKYAYDKTFTIITATMPSIKEKPDTLYSVRTYFGYYIVYKQGGKVLLDSYHSSSNGPIRFEYVQHDYKSLVSVAKKSGFSMKDMETAYKEFEERDPKNKRTFVLPEEDNADKFLILLSNVSTLVERKDLESEERQILESLITSIFGLLGLQQDKSAITEEAGSNLIVEKWKRIDSILRQMHQERKKGDNTGEVAEQRNKKLNNITHLIKVTDLLEEKKDSGFIDLSKNRRKDRNGYKGEEEKDKKKPYPVWIKVLAVGIVVCIVGGVVFVVVKRQGKKEIKVVDPELAAISEAFV